MPLSRRRRVTVINDSSDFVALMAEALRDHECEVTGFAAVQVEFDEVVESRPDLLVVDLILGSPEQQMGGWELILLARSHRDLKHVPIILCSADLQTLRDRKEELAGMAGVHVLEKPFDLDDLDRLVERLLTP